MKTKPLLLTLLLCLAFAAAPAFAQSERTELVLQKILHNHPDLAANPSLVNNPLWEKNHPNVMAWFRGHPDARRQTAQMGAWETNGTWHDPDWWFHNNPNWVYQNRPDWIQRYPAWHQYGDWDADDHQWHDRDWYWQNRRQWAIQHHPEWQHEEEEEAEHHHGPPPWAPAHGWRKHHHDDD